MESIDWQKIYRKADNFGKGLADFLNGLISPRLFYDLGATIAGSLNTALHFLNSFGTTFDWTNFGLSIANGINGFFKNFDFALLAKTINAWVQGIYTMLTTAIKNVSWKDVLKGITDFLSKPYYELKYRQVGKKDYSIGYSSYDLKTVLGCIDEYFEIVESDKQTNADRIRNMSDEELAEFLTTVTSDAICGSSWDYDGWIKELQSEAE